MDEIGLASLVDELASHEAMFLLLPPERITQREAEIANAELARRGTKSRVHVGRMTVLTTS